VVSLSLLKEFYKMKMHTHKTHQALYMPSVGLGEKTNKQTNKQTNNRQAKNKLIVLLSIS